MSYKVISPCSEDWDKMSPVDSGRFCDKCMKNVHDLTVPGSALAPGSGKACGRIKENKPEIFSFRSFMLRQKPLRYAALMLLLLVTKFTKAQSVKADTNTENDTSVKIKPDSLTKKITISGTLTDKANKEPIPFAVVVAYDKEMSELGKTTSDFDGNYKLELTNVKGTHISLKAVYVGYNTVLIKDIPLGNTRRNIHMNLSPEAVSIGLIIYCPPIMDDWGVFKRDVYNRMAKP